MSAHRSALVLAGAALAAVVAAVLLSAGNAPAKHSPKPGSPASVAQRLVGRWSGPKFGAEADSFRSDQWELVFERASGPALIGKKRHRVDDGWSPFEQVDAVVDSSLHIWAVDEDGTINGRLRANGTLELVYQEPGTDDAAAAVVRLTRSPS